MKQFKTYNDKDYETDSSCVLFQYIIIFLVCPFLLIFLPYIIYDEYKNGNKSSAITLLLIFGFCFLFIVYAVFT